MRQYFIFKFWLNYSIRVLLAYGRDLKATARWLHAVLESFMWNDFVKVQKS